MTGKTFDLTLHSATGLARGIYSDSAADRRYALHGVVLQSHAQVLGITDSLLDRMAAWAVGTADSD